MASKGQTTTKRLLHELQSYKQEPSDALLELGPVNDDELLHWAAIMKGVEGTAYEGDQSLEHKSSGIVLRECLGGIWKLDIHIPDSYPLAPPTVRFVTPICHPNVHFKTGEICLDLLKTSWSPAYTIVSTMNAIHQLLTSAEPDSPLNVDIAQLFRQGDDIGSQALISFYTDSERWEGP